MSRIDDYKAEYKRYKYLLEGTLTQVSDEQLHQTLSKSEHSNSIATILQHLSGNFKSRFSDFKTADGEKPWRQRDAEFIDQGLDKEQLISEWNEAWQVLETALDSITDDELGNTISIRGKQIAIGEALCRSMTHFSYHVGEIVLMARCFTEDSWTYLSVAPGESASYRTNPDKESFRNR